MNLAHVLPAAMLPADAPEPPKDFNASLLDGCVLRIQELEAEVSNWKAAVNNLRQGHPEIEEDWQRIARAHGLTTT